MTMADFEAVLLLANGTEGDANRRAFIATGSIYAVLFVVCVVQLVRNCRSYAQWTQQKWMHLLLVLLTLTRAGFLLSVGIFNWCDVTSEGVLSPACEANGLERQLFYILDQLPNMFFFSMYLVMGLFWAEIYYNATDQLDIFLHVIKPVSKLFHVMAYFLQIGLWILYADPWRSEDHYFGRGYAAFSTSIFLLVTTAFVVYGRLAYVELRAVPVDLPIRTRKLKEVTVMTTICTTCFTARSLLILHLSQDHVQLADHLTWLMILLYYSLFELLPTVVILHFHRRFPRPQASPTLAKAAPYRFIEDSLRQTLIHPSSP
ncbi:hypothetical protein AC1031_007243 [Aphanomyces cochlioides]|nr:hypothetical protein AC1031_007243 [Aphanomyces cochlioides]